MYNNYKANSAQILKIKPVVILRNHKMKQAANLKIIIQSKMILHLKKKKALTKIQTKPILIHRLYRTSPNLLPTNLQMETCHRISAVETWALMEVRVTGAILMDWVEVKKTRPRLISAQWMSYLLLLLFSAPCKSIVDINSWLPENLKTGKKFKIRLSQSYQKCLRLILRFNENSGIYWNSNWFVDLLLN